MFIKRFSVFVVIALIVGLARVYLGNEPVPNAMGSSMVVLLFGAYYSWRG